MGTYESYQDYKNSKNNWIGNVPTHWNIQRADFLIQTNRRQVSAESLDGVELIHYSIPNVQEFGTGKLENGDQIDSAKLLISEQQLLVSKLNPRKSTLCIAVPNDQYTVVASSEFVPLLAGKTHLEYSYYVWGSDKVTKLLSSMVQSVTRSHQRVNPSDILKIYWAWPPIHEQKAIARFLDYKTAQIDALIAKKQALLEKLAEQRTALISQAVTKGLDPSVPMKDSGVEWLGEIPAHWQVSKLGYVAKSLQTGPFGSQLHADEYVEDGTPLINPSDISNGKLTGNPTITVEEAVVARLSRHKLELGDIVIARRGEMGRAGLVGKDNVGWLCGTGSLRARLNKDVINPKYLLYQFSMRGVSEYLSLQSVGSTMDNLNTSILGRLWVVVPPLHEQSDIISEVQKVSLRIEKMRNSVTSAISKLQEYRAALITNAVTGKIDVRDFRLPTTTEQKELAHG